MSERQLIAAECKAGVPFKLDLNGLSHAARQTARERYLEISINAVRLTAEALERVPTPKEIELIRTACTKLLNEVLIPQIRARDLTIH